MDHVTCCLLGICCPPFSPEQRDTLLEQLALQVGKEKAEKIVADVYEEFAAVTKRIAALVAE